MTSNILQKKERRRLAKSSVDEYNKLDAEIRRECQTAKELMLTAQCEKIEQLDAAHMSNQVHAQIRQATGRKQSACLTTYIEDKDGNIIMEQDKILARWHEYISEIFMEISQVQYGFIPDRGTRNAMFVLRRLVERSIQKQKDVFT